MSSRPSTSNSAVDRVIIRRGAERVLEQRLSGDRLVIGRTPEVHLRLDHASVSRRHAELIREGDRWRIVDLGSMNGLLVNGEPTRGALLAPGDLVEVRPFVLEFRGPMDSDSSGVSLAEMSSITSIGPSQALPQALVRQRLEDLYGLSRLLLERGGTTPLWSAVQSALQRSLGAERCIVIGVSEAGALYSLTHEGSIGRPRLGVSRSVLNEVIANRKGVLVERVSDSDIFREAQSLAGGGVASVLCVPVMRRGRVMAIAYAERGRWTPAFRDEDLNYAAGAMDLAAAALEIDELNQRSRELAQLRGRIAAAREIQEMLLPTPLPQPTWGEVAAINVPAETMSGDVYDAAIDPQGRLVLMLADVAGKSVPAAFVTAALVTALRVSVPENLPLTTIAQRMNAAIEAHSQEGLFATMLLARFSPDGRSAEIANCGHHAPLLLAPGAAPREGPSRTGLPLGVGKTWQGAAAEIALPERTLLIGYSDGVTEALDSNKREFGESGLLALLERAKPSSAAPATEEIVKAVRAHCAPQEPSDDLTVIAVCAGR
ncbi:MAG: SpoIIE family protein phosphatase [Phycisphaerae bacterium]|nr:SpoIIE family protein phosphatase [Phycisphaerae bacterium]